MGVITNSIVCFVFLLFCFCFLLHFAFCKTSLSLLCRCSSRPLSSILYSASPFSSVSFFWASQNCVSLPASVSSDRIMQAVRVYRDTFTDDYMEQHTDMHIPTLINTSMYYLLYDLSLTNTFSLTSTHLTHRRKSPVTYSILIVVHILCPEAFPSCVFVCPWGVQA